MNDTAMERPRVEQPETEYQYLILCMALLNSISAFLTLQMKGYRVESLNKLPNLISLLKSRTKMQKSSSSGAKSTDSS